MRGEPFGPATRRHGSPRSGKIAPSSQTGPRGVLSFHSSSLLTIHSARFCSTDSTQLSDSLIGIRTVSPALLILMPMVLRRQRMRTYCTSLPLRLMRRSSLADNFALPDVRDKFVRDKLPSIVMLFVVCDALYAPLLPQSMIPPGH